MLNHKELKDQDLELIVGGARTQQSSETEPTLVTFVKPPHVCEAIESDRRELGC